MKGFNYTSTVFNFPPSSRLKSPKVAIIFWRILLKSPKVAQSYGNFRSQSRPCNTRLSSVVSPTLYIRFGIQFLKCVIVIVIHIRKENNVACASPISFVPSGTKFLVCLHSVIIASHSYVLTVGSWTKEI